MEEQKIERYVRDLLTVSGFHGEGKERRLWTLLHHLYCAVAMYEQASKDERATIAGVQKKLRYFFEAKCDLKERKRNKKENESIPPAPPIKEKENKKEKAEKMTHTLKGVRDADFESEEGYLQKAVFSVCRQI